MNQRRDLMPIDQIVDMLRARMPELARRLIPLGHAEGDEWRAARQRMGGIGDSFAVCISGPRAGYWLHGAAGRQSSSPLKLIAYLETGDNMGDAVRWAKGFLGLDGTDPASLRQSRAAVERANQRRDEIEAADAKKRKRAHAIFLNAGAALGSPVDAYLKARLIDLARLDFPTNAIRYHPEVWHHTGRSYPAMVAPIQSLAGDFMAVHRTYLELIDGVWQKARPQGDSGDEASKMVLGRYRGGFIRVWSGIVTDPNTGEIRKAPRLSSVKEPVWIDVTEGIEDALTVAIHAPELRVVSGVSLSNMAALRFPECVAGVVLWQQNDAVDSAAARGFLRVIDNFVGQGLRVKLARVPEQFKDVNDFIRAIAATGA